MALDSSSVAIVTGAGRGIGRGIALALAARGAHLVLTSRTEAELVETERLVTDLGIKQSTLIIPGNITDEAFIERLFTHTISRFGPPSILVNNAGVAHVAPVVGHATSDWDETMAVNIRAVFLCCRAFFNVPPNPGGDRAVVNISSLGGIRSTTKFPGLAAYVASKFAVVGLTEALAVEGKALGIRVNCIAPGAVDTEMLRRAAPHLRTSTSPADVGAVVCFLADYAASKSVTGVTMELHSNE